MALRVFVSHSVQSEESLEQKLESVTSPQEAEARRARNTMARRVRNDLLRIAEADPKGEPGLPILFLHDGDLQPGAAWHSHISRWMHLCDAAVILIDRDSRASKWVQHEVSVLMHRCHTGSPVQILPLIMDGTTQNELSASFGPSDLLSKQLVRWDEGRGLKSLVQRLEKLEGESTPPASPMERWSARLAEPLAASLRAGTGDFEDAELSLGIDPDRSLTPATERPLTLGHSLLSADRESQRYAAYCASQALSRDHRERLAELLLPAWVSPDVGARVAGAHASDAVWAIALVERPIGLVHDLLYRTWCKDFSKSAIIELPDIIGPEPVGRLGELLDQALSEKLFRDGRRPVRANNMDRLEERRVRQVDPFVVVIRGEALTLKAIEELATAYGDFILVFAVGCASADLDPRLHKSAAILWLGMVATPQIVAERKDFWIDICSDGEPYDACYWEGAT